MVAYSMQKFMAKNMVQINSTFAKPAKSLLFSASISNKSFYAKIIVVYITKKPSQLPQSVIKRSVLARNLVSSVRQ